MTDSARNHIHQDLSKLYGPIGIRAVAAAVSVRGAPATLASSPVRKPIGSDEGPVPSEVG